MSKKLDFFSSARISSAAGTGLITVVSDPPAAFSSASKSSSATSLVDAPVDAAVELSPPSSDQAVVVVGTTGATTGFAIGVPLAAATRCSRNSSAV